MAGPVRESEWGMGMRRAAIEATEFQRLEVWTSSASCEFRVAGAVHAWWHRDRFLTGLAWDNLAAGVFLRPGGPPKSVLMLGLAGGTTLRILRRLLPEGAFTAVDIDGQVVELARRHMRLEETDVRVVIGDAYEWALGARETYDAVIDDCYLAGEEDVFRPQSNPCRGIELLGRLVAPGGVFLTNLVTGPGHRRLQSRTRAAFKRAFAEVRSVTTPDSLNETLVGGGALGGVAALGGLAGCFDDRRDRELWRRLRVRRLGGAGEGDRVENCGGE